MIISESKIKNLSEKLESGFPQIAFAYLFGSAAKGKLKKGSDIDIAVFLKPENKSLELISGIIGTVEEAIPEYPCDLLILNKADELIAFEVLNGKLLFVRDEALDDYAGYYSLTCRKSEDKRVWMKKQLEYRDYEVQWDN